VSDTGVQNYMVTKMIQTGWRDWNLNIVEVVNGCLVIIISLQDGRVGGFEEMMVLNVD